MFETDYISFLFVFRKKDCSSLKLGETFRDLCGYKRYPVTRHKMKSIQCEHACFCLNIANIVWLISQVSTQLQANIFRRLSFVDVRWRNYSNLSILLRQSSSQVSTDDIYIWGSNNGRRRQQPDQTWIHLKRTNPPNEYLGHGPKSTLSAMDEHANYWSCSSSNDLTLTRKYFWETVCNFTKHNIMSVQNGSWICVRQSCLQSYTLHICQTTSQELGSKIMK